MEPSACLPVSVHGGERATFSSTTFDEPLSSFSPKEHHVFDVLHWVKAAFKKHALDQIQADDCSNKEAYR